MPRLLVLNNYSLERVQEEVRRGDKPAHHLYGIDWFPKLGYDVESVPIDESVGPLPRPLARAIAALPPVGNPRQQMAALRRIDDADLVYAPCQTQTQMLSYLRALGLVRVPIVTLAHHPVARSRWIWNAPFLRLQMRGTDAFPSLSRAVARELVALSGRMEFSQAVPWGPDLSYYPPPDGTPGVGVIAAGRTGRDFLTFARAATRAGVPATILCLRSAGIHLGDLGPNVSLTAVEQESDLNYRKMVPLFAAARVHAIPLHIGFSLSGLTSLTDALALGKPVIMTRHPLIDVDLEGEGIGRWIDAGDIDGWAAAMRWFEDHPDESIAMGRRARALAERSYNSEIFSRRMVGIFDRLLEIGAARTQT